MTSKEFGQYLLRELLWELSTNEVIIPGLTDVPMEKIEVLFCTGYTHVRLRTPSGIIDARLSWKGDTAPIIVESVAKGVSEATIAGKPTIG